MDEKEIYEARRQKLKDLIRLFYRNNQAAFSRAVKIDPTSINRMLYEEGKDGKKNIGEETILKIEKVHPYWFLPGLAGQLVFLFMNMSQDHQDELLGRANRYFSEDNLQNRQADPYPVSPKNEKEKQ